MPRGFGAALFLLLLNGCASRAAPTKSGSDAAVDSWTTPESDSMTPPADTLAPVDTALPDTGVLPDTEKADAAED